MARVPADVEKKDAILFGFTFRQVVILTVAGLIIYTAWTALAKVVHPLVFLIGAIPVAGFAFVLAVGRRDGISLDAWLAHAIRHRRTPHQLVPTDGPITPAPAWVRTTAGRGDKLPLPAPLRLPAKGITGDGLVDYLDKPYLSQAVELVPARFAVVVGTYAARPRARRRTESARRTRTSPRPGCQRSCNSPV